MASGGSCIIDWGDNTTSSVTLTADGWKATTHTYSPYVGNRIITIEVLSGSIGLGYYGANNTIVGQDSYNKLSVEKIEIGDNVDSYGRNAFNGFLNMKSISIPITCNAMDTGNDAGLFGMAPSLQAVVFPSGEIGRQQNDKVFFAANGSPLLKYISIPKSMTHFGMSTFPRNLRKFIMYFLDNTSNSTYLYDCTSLTHYIVPGSYTSIPGDRCRASFIKKLIIPKTVTSIGATAFTYNNWCSEVHLLP